MACTGMSASWCPHCGDCSCERGEDNERIAIDSDCLLHGTGSTHAVDRHTLPLFGDDD